VITRGLFTTKDRFISHTITTDNDFFFSVLEISEIIPLEIIVSCSPLKSLRNLPLQSGLSYGSVRKAAEILKLHPYRVHVMHKLKEPGKEKQL
jgi:hypothetical protein